MGKPLTIQAEDDVKIEALKKQLGLKTKIEVVRSALKLLEAEADRQTRVERWRKAAKIVGGSGLEILKEFVNPNRFKNIP
ncbi:MAG: hypothetical protein SGJ18_03045 [Pseudomonadota bacterium]|nr:hypothetical protein [Pseudomonadota bacterium]